MALTCALSLLHPHQPQKVGDRAGPPGRAHCVFLPGSMEWGAAFLWRAPSAGKIVSMELISVWLSRSSTMAASVQTQTSSRVGDSHPFKNTAFKK